WIWTPPAWCTSPPSSGPRARAHSRTAHTHLFPRTHLFPPRAGLPNSQKWRVRAAGTRHVWLFEGVDDGRGGRWGAGEGGGARPEPGARGAGRALRGSAVGFLGARRWFAGGRGRWRVARRGPVGPGVLSESTRSGFSGPGDVQQVGGRPLGAGMLAEAEGAEHGLSRVAVLDAQADLPYPLFGRLAHQ